MGVREFTGDLDPVPVVKEFTGTLDGEEPGLIDRVKGSLGAGAAEEEPPVFVDPAATASAERMLGFEPTRPVQEVGFAEAGRQSMANERRAQRAAERAAMPSIEPTPASGMSKVASGLATGLKTDIGKAGSVPIRAAGKFFADEAIGNPELQAAGRYVEEAGKHLWDKYAKEEARNQPEFESVVGRGIYGGARSLEQMLAALAVSGGNPGGTLAAMVGPLAATETGTALAKGHDLSTSISYGLGQGGLEYLTEKVPMGFLVKKLGRVGFGEFTRGFLARELPSEQLATLTQDALQKAILEPEKTWAQYWAERPEAAAETALATGVIAAGAGGLNRLARGTVQQAKEPTPDELREAQVAQANAAAGAELRAALAGDAMPAPSAPAAPADTGGTEAANTGAAASVQPPSVSSPQATTVAPGSMLASQGLADPNAPAVVEPAAAPMPTTATLPDGSSIAGQVLGETPEGDTEFLGDDGVSYRFAPGEATFGDVQAPAAAVEPVPQPVTELPAEPAPRVSILPEGVPLDGEIPTVQADAEMAAPSVEATSRELSGSGSVLAPEPAGDVTGTGDRAEVDAPSVRPAAPVRAPSAESVAPRQVDATPVLQAQKQPEAASIKAPDMVDVQTADGRTVRVLRSELDSPRALLRVHDAAGQLMQNQDGNALLVKREQLAPRQSAASASQPKPEAPPQAVPIQPPAKPKAASPAAPKSLLTFLKSKGGINTAEAEDLGGEPAKVLNKRFPTLFRKAGLSADAAREVLQQHGWLDGIAEAEQLEETRFLIMKALRGDKSVVKDAVALLEAEADARAAEYYAENGGHPSHHADDMNAAVESLADLQLDAAIDAAWNSTEGSMSDEDISAWLGEDQTDASPQGAEETAAGTTPSGAVESGNEATQEQSDGEVESTEAPKADEPILPPKGAEEWSEQYSAKAWDAEQSKFVREDVTVAEALSAIDDDIAALEQFRKCLG